jgi:chemotaxis signal transduction protein
MAALLFQLDKRCWAVDAAYVSRVIPDQPVRPAGFLPSQFRGVVAYAGEVLPLLDLHKQLDLGERESEGGELIVLAFAGQNYALRVERVVQTIAYEEGEDVVWRGQPVAFIDLTTMLSEALAEGAMAPLQGPSRSRPLETAAAHSDTELPALAEIRAAKAASLVVEIETGRERLPRYSVVELCEDLPIVAVPDPRPLFQGAAFYRDQLIPIVSLDALLARTEQHSSSRNVFVIVDVAGRLCALSVKSIVGMSNDPAPILDLRALLSEHLPEELERAAPRPQGGEEMSGPDSARFLVTEAGGRSCGFRLESVVHIHAASAVIRAPKPESKAPLGVASIAGRVMPVLDLAGSLGLGNTKRAQQFVELASIGEANFAVAVDRVVGIAALPASALLPAPRGNHISTLATRADAPLLWIVDPVSLAEALQGGAHAG